MASCADGVKNQDETGTDCGGVCAACDAGQPVGGGACPGCDAGPPTPTASCADGAQNQDETGIDCGGVCRACDAGPPLASCADGAQNQEETGIDCGGVCRACDAGPPPPPLANCTDGAQNQDETGIDCGGVCTPCPTSCTVVVADSVADFSSTQGQGGWFYGYYQEPNFLSANFVPFSVYRFQASVNDEGWFSSTGTWTWVGRLRMHPNGHSTSGAAPPIEQHAVRRWVSPIAATLFVQGALRSTSPDSSGVRGSVRVGDTEVWQQVVPPRQNTAFPFQVVLNLRVGDVVNAVLDPFQSNDGADDTEFSLQLCR